VGNETQGISQLCPPSGAASFRGLHIAAISPARCCQERGGPVNPRAQPDISEASKEGEVLSPEVIDALEKKLVSAAGIEPTTY
jgi:hypothetical protein